jgi:hypothetical protein
MNLGLCNNAASTAGDGDIDYAHWASKDLVGGGRDILRYHSVEEVKTKEISMREASNTDEIRTRYLTDVSLGRWRYADWSEVSPMWRM